MKTHADKAQDNKSQSIANEVSQKQSGGEFAFQLPAHQPEAIAQRELRKMASNSPQVKKLKKPWCQTYTFDKPVWR